MIDSVPMPLSPTPPAVMSAPNVKAPAPLLIVTPVAIARLPVAYNVSGPLVLVALALTFSATSDPEAVRLIAPLPVLLTGADSVRAPVLATVTVPVPASLIPVPITDSAASFVRLILPPACWRR